MRLFRQPDLPAACYPTNLQTISIIPFRFSTVFPPSFNGIFLHGWPAMDIPVKLSAGGSISPDLGGQHRANWGAMLRDHKLWLVYIF